VADPGLDLAFPLVIADATREADDAVVREHVAVERIERRLVDVRGEHALFEVIEDDGPRRPAQPTEGAFVERRPRLGARLPHQQPHSLARVRERQDKQRGAAILAGLRMADHRAVAVVDLAFLAGRRDDDDARVGRRGPAQLPNEAPDAGVARGEADLVDQVLPDRHGIAADLHGGFDLVAIRRTRTRLRRTTRPRVGGHRRPRNCRICRWVGGHLRRNCWFCRSFARATASTDGQARRTDIARDRLPVDADGRGDATDGPPELRQCQDLLLLCRLQDVTHPGEGHQVRRPAHQARRDASTTAPHGLSCIYTNLLSHCPASR